MKRNNSLWRPACCLMAAMLTLGGCQEKEKPEYSYEYLPVQMSKDESWSIIDKDGKEVVKEEYPADAVLSEISSEGIYWVMQGDKYQLYNLKDPKKPLIDETFTRATKFKAGVAVVSNPNQAIRIIDTDGKTVATLPKNIKRCNEFVEPGYAVFRNSDDKEGILDKHGNIVVPAAYDVMGTPSDGLTFVRKKKDDTKWTVIDMNGKEQFSGSDEKILPFGNYHEGKIIVCSNYQEVKDRKFSVLDKTGKKLFDIRKAEGGYCGNKYIDGYLVFASSDDKWGVVDDKGEVVIRAKYDGMAYLGNGMFAAKKGEKCGIVNVKDETVIDFDYDGNGGTMGDNFLMFDGSSIALIGKDGKEITSFHRTFFNSNFYAEYVDVTSIGNSITRALGEMEQTQTADKVARADSLNIDNYRYQSYITRELNVDDKVKSSYYIWFGGYMAEEKTHEEQVNDGWFTYNRTVSDGWQWTNVMPARINGSLKIEDDAIDAKELYKQLCQRLAEGRKKISEGKFSKNVKIGGKTVECLTSLTNGEKSIDFEITFKQ